MTDIQRIKSDIATTDRRELEDDATSNSRIRNDEVTKERRSEADKTKDEHRSKNDKITAERREVKDANPTTPILKILSVFLIGLVAGTFFIFS